MHSITRLCPLLLVGWYEHILAHILSTHINSISVSAHTHSRYAHMNLYSIAYAFIGVYIYDDWLMCIK